MPAYNPPPQTLFSPVSNYYQGKAIRQQLAAGEQDAEFKGLQIDAAKQELADAPARKMLANQKAAADYAAVLEGIRGKKLANEGAEMDAARDVVGPWIAEYDKKGIGWANENFEELVLNRLPENKRAEFAKVRESDGNPQWNEDEMAKVGLMIAINEVDKDPDPTSHQKHLQSLVDQGFITQEKMNETMLGIEEKAAKAVEMSYDVGDSVRLAENFTSDSIRDYERELANGNLDSSLLKPLLDPDEDAAELALQIDNSVKTIDDAIALTSNMTTGIPGGIKRLWETGEAYVNPDADQPAKDFAEKVMLLQATNWREIVGAGQLSKADYVFLDGLFKGKGWLDDPVSTRRSLNLLKDWLNAKKSISGSLDSGGAYKRARDAIAAGADRDAVIKRLEDNGYDSSRL